MFIGEKVSSLITLDLTNLFCSLASVNVEVFGELVDPFLEFGFAESSVFSSLFSCGFFNPGHVFFGWLVVSGFSEGFEGSFEFFFVNLTVVVGVDGGEHGFGFI